jgi:extracellular factor (EF) 3-hydroxypalmitic acid methyl ester biosynthesis protein
MIPFGLRIVPVNPSTDSHDLIRSIAARGGPTADDEPPFESPLTDRFLARARGLLTSLDLLAFRAAFGDSLATGETLQGLALTKPHGYPGDFEILDKVYRSHVSDDPRFRQ